MPTAAQRNTDNSRAADSVPTNGNGNGDGPRRSSLVQERSRRTRQELVNAAVRLWTERGFEHGVESTTVAIRGLRQQTSQHSVQAITF